LNFSYSFKCSATFSNNPLNFLISSELFQKISVNFHELSTT